MCSRCFKLGRAYSILFIRLKTVSKFRKRRRKSLHCLFALHKRALSCRSHAVIAKKCTKNTCKVVVEPIAFLSSAARFPNMVLRKLNIHKHWTLVTRFNPVWIFLLLHLHLYSIEALRHIRLCKPRYLIVLLLLTALPLSQYRSERKTAVPACCKIRSFWLIIDIEHNELNQTNSSTMDDKRKVNSPPPHLLSKEGPIWLFNFNFRELESKESLSEIQNQLKMIPQ